MVRPYFNSPTLDRFILLSFVLVVALGTVLVSFPDGAAAILVVLILTGLCLYIFRSFTDDKDFIARLFILGLAVRLAFGIFIHVAELRDFFGGDANTYDFRGSILVGEWLGHSIANQIETRIAISTSTPGWGMNYLVGFLYLLLGKNIFAAQSFCAVVGAATAPMAYFCADRVFENKQVARYSGLAVAFFPAMIIWSSQLLKDGVIIFLLLLAMTLVLQLQRKIDFFSLVLLAFSLFGILSMRFYIFYMVVVAVIGSFLVGASKSNKSMIGRIAVLGVLGLAFTYFGVIRIASTSFERYGDLAKVQNSRMDLARSAQSGFGAETDVSTAEGAITAIPIGLIVLMLAPFPWQATSLRSAIAVPETILWWAMLPMIFAGIMYAIRFRLRSALPILVFSLMLTFAYSIFQGNVGTAYRQRTQIQVFLFIFAAVGWTLRQEKRADAKLLLMQQNKRLEAALRARREARS